MVSPQKLKRVAAIPQLLRNRIRGPEDLKRFPGLKSAKLVTLDVFDTALLGSVAQPTDALALTAWRTNQRHNLNLGMQPLLEARRTAESTARQKARATGREEVTLDEIYATFPGPLSTVAPLMHAEELATERDICSANPAVLAIYKQLVASNTPVAFLSDTYFPQPFLESLLSDSGYDGPHQVFVSSHFGTSKAHGALFAKVAAQLTLQPRDIWHIGDNAQSDVLQARRAGLQALWYRPKLRRPTHQDRTEYARDERSLARSLMAGIPESLQDQTSITAQPWKKIGVSVAGPLYLGFTQWLMADLSDFAPKHIYFFSRDGQIVQRVYERLRACFPLAPASSYLMVSRRAVVIPALERVDEVALEHFLGRGHQLWLPVEEYLTRIGLELSACETAMIEHGIPPGTLMDTEEKRDRLRSLFQFLEPQVLQVAKQERLLLSRYLEQQGCFDHDASAFCDIGYKGSLQRALTPIFRANTEDLRLRGYYLATSHHIRQLAGSGGDALGWLIDTDVPEYNRRILQTGVAVIELLFTADHGSVLRYNETQGKVIPFQAPLGLSSNYAAAATAMQQAALLFVERYLKAFGDLPPLILDRELAFPALARLIDCPSLAEAKAIGDLVQVDGFSANGANHGHPIAQPPAFWEFILKPSTTMKRFLQAPWRLGFLARLIGSPKVAFAAMALRRRLEFRPKSA